MPEGVNRTIWAAIMAALLLVTTAPSAEAQSRPGPALEFAAGWVGFADDAVVSEGLVGGAARFYATPRLAFGPEIAFIDGNRHSHLMITGNLTFDLLGYVAGEPPKVDPFVVAGGGLFQTRETFPTGSFTSGDPSFTAGGGVRVHLGRRIYAGAEARIGWETHLRLNAVVGVRLR
jgi:hypothetical protein